MINCSFVIMKCLPWSVVVVSVYFIWKRQSHTSFLILICTVYLSTFCPWVCNVCPSPPTSGLIHDILLIFGFWQFNEDIPKYVSFFIYAWMCCWCLDVYINVFLQIWRIFSPISYIYICKMLPHLLSSPSGTPIVCITDSVVPDITKTLLMFLKSVFLPFFRLDLLFQILSFYFLEFPFRPFLWFQFCCRYPHMFPH